MRLADVPILQSAVFLHIAVRKVGGVVDNKINSGLMSHFEIILQPLEISVIFELCLDALALELYLEGRQCALVEALGGVVFFKKALDEFIDVT